MLFPDNIITDIRQLIWAPIPLVILVPSNMLIIIKLLYGKKKWGNDQTSETKKSTNITIMMLSITASFTFLALPSCIHILCCRHLPTFYKILDYLNILSVINASLNFYLYMASSKAFRRAAWQHFAHLFNDCMIIFTCSNAIAPLED